MRSGAGLPNPQPLPSEGRGACHWNIEVMGNIEASQ